MRLCAEKWVVVTVFLCTLVSYYSGVLHWTKWGLHCWSMVDLCCNLEMFWSNWCHYNHVLSRCYHFCMNTIHVVSLLFYCSITKIQLIKLDIRFQLLRTLPAENYLLQQLHAWYELQVCLYWVHKCVCAWVFDPLAAHHDRLMPYFLLRRLNAIVIATWARSRAIVDLCILGAGSLLVFLACFPTHFSR